MSHEIIDIATKKPRGRPKGIPGNRKANARNAWKNGAGSKRRDPAVLLDVAVEQKDVDAYQRVYEKALAGDHGPLDRLLSAEMARMHATYTQAAQVVSKRLAEYGTVAVPRYVVTVEGKIVTDPETGAPLINGFVNDKALFDFLADAGSRLGLSADALNMTPKAQGRFPKVQNETVLDEIEAGMDEIREVG
jgi:hypothetical protein